MTTRKYLVLVAVVIFASTGDASLARGMKDFGPVTMENLSHLLTGLLNPWIFLGVGLLTLFYASYLSALSWADLTYVLPATSLSYVMMALLGKFFLHESVTFWHWIGIAMITSGVGFVATGPEKTHGAHRSDSATLPLAHEAGSDT